MLRPDLDSKLLREWLSTPDDAPSKYAVSGCRIIALAQSGGTTTVAARYRAHDSGETVVIAKDGFPLQYFDASDAMVVSLNNTTVAKIFRYFDLEFHTLRGGSSEGGMTIRTAVKTFQELGLPFPYRLESASRCPEGLETQGMPLLAFKDLMVPRRYRYAILNSGLSLPSRLQKSFLDKGGFIILQSEDDAAEIKMRSDKDASIIDLWPDVEVQVPDIG